MIRIIGVLAVVLASGVAAAQGRPSSTEMTCEQAVGLVAARGAIVLGTGGYTFERLVRDRSFCEITESTQIVRAPTRDQPGCVVGYRCYEPTQERDDR